VAGVGAIQCFSVKRQRSEIDERSKEVFIAQIVSEPCDDDEDEYRD
jgi:hypothetical protein